MALFYIFENFFAVLLNEDSWVLSHTSAFSLLLGAVLVEIYKKI